VAFFDAGLVVTVETKKSLVSIGQAPPLGFLLSFAVVAVVWILFAVAVLRELVTLQLAAGILIIGAVPVLSLVLISPSTPSLPIAYIIFGVYAAASASILAFPLFGRWFS